MFTDTDIKQWLVEQLAAAEARLTEAGADVEAARRMLERYERSQPAPTPASSEEIREAAIEALKEYGKPIHRQDLYDALVSRGVHINGKDPVANLGAILSRCGDDFVPYGSGIWGLREPLPREKDQSRLIINRSDDIDDLPF